MMNENKDKTLVIMRGISGSGKSTFANGFKDVMENYERTVQICSADNFFDSGEEYNFDPRFIKYAHQMCKAEVAQSILEETNVIIVDNTHTKTWEYEKYVEMANDFDYKVIVANMMEARPKDLSDEEYVNLCHGRNQHGVPKTHVRKMFDRFQSTKDGLEEMDMSHGVLNIVHSFVKLHI